MSFRDKWFNMLANLNDASPKIKIVIGVVGLVGAGVAACIATTRVKEKTKKEREIFDDIHKVRQSQKNELPEEEKIPDDITACYSEKDYAKDILRASGTMTFKLLKVYALPIGLAILSACLIFNGMNIMSNRDAAISAAYATLSTCFNEYREKVKDKYGEEVEKELYYGVTYRDIEIYEKDENGELKKTGEEKAAVANIGDHFESLYLIKFNRECAEWCNDFEYNQTFLRGIQAMLRDELKHKPFITFSDLCDKIGKDITKWDKSYQLMAMRCGWRHGDNVDLRIQRLHIPADNECSVPILILDPNVRDIYAEIITENSYEPSSL